jgi:hypothetical protein
LLSSDQIPSYSPDLQTKEINKKNVPRGFSVIAGFFVLGSLAVGVIQGRTFPPEAHNVGALFLIVFLPGIYG